ncbi:hypothetical protein D3C80_1498220 [compost metagenome]
MTLSGGLMMQARKVVSCRGVCGTVMGVGLEGRNLIPFAQLNDDAAFFDGDDLGSVRNPLKPPSPHLDTDIR